VASGLTKKPFTPNLEAFSEFISGVPPSSTHVICILYDPPVARHYVRDKERSTSSGSTWGLISHDIVTITNLHDFYHTARVIVSARTDRHYKCAKELVMRVGKSDPSSYSYRINAISPPHTCTSIVIPAFIEQSENDPLLLDKTRLSQLSAVKSQQRPELDMLLTCL